MRTFCLLLILTNALFFIWSQLIDVQVSALDRGAAPSAEPPPRIVLAREVADAEPGSAPDVTAREVQPPTVEPLAARAGSTIDALARSAEPAGLNQLACTSVGPFPDLPQAAEAQGALRSAGYSSQQRLAEGELWVGYWVSVQNLVTREAAENAVATLADAGITDVYLMPGSAPAYVLSLGVFSDYQRAQRRLKEVRALGLDPRIQDRKRAGSVYWLDIELPEPGHGVDLSLLQTDVGKITRLELRACPASPDAGEARSG